jgi:hypothetical protein
MQPWGSARNWKPQTEERKQESENWKAQTANKNAQMAAAS